MFINGEVQESCFDRVDQKEVRLSEWFDQQSRGPSTSFWFHDKFPARVLCILIEPVLYFKRPKVFINGEVQESCFDRVDQKEVRLS